MNHTTYVLVKVLVKPTLHALALFIILSVLSGCAELEQLTKPSVEGLQQAADFNSLSLIQGGFNNTRIISSLGNDEVNSKAFMPMLNGAIRSKRPDLAIGSSGRYQITANVIANDVSHREDNFNKTVYKWSKRRVKISYVIVDAFTRRQVWSGIIETYDEPLASYEQKKKKSRDKVIDAIVAAIDKTEVYPYPEVPIFSDVVQRNFEGFALNLPFKKK